MTVGCRNNLRRRSSRAPAGEQAAVLLAGFDVFQDRFHRSLVDHRPHVEVLGRIADRESSPPAPSASRGTCRRLRSSTIAREQAEHFCPWNPNAACATPSTAASRSASASTMMASLPPISRIVRLIQIWPGGLRGRTLIDVQSHFARAREGDVAGLRMRHHRISESSARARTEVHHAFRHAGFFQQFDELRRNGRRIAGGLQDHRVAADNRGQRHAGHDRAGKIPRRNHRAHAQRNVEQLIALSRQLHRRLSLGQAQRLRRRVRRNRWSRRCRRRPPPSSC